MKTAELAMFMVSANLFTILLYHPASPVVQAIPSEFFRRVLTGLAMGLTLVAIVYSPWGKRSGAHMNPAFTLTFLRLGKVAPWDAFFYVAAQFAGGAGGILAVVSVAAGSMAHPSVNYVATLPGPVGAQAAFIAEAPRLMERIAGRLDEIAEREIPEEVGEIESAVKYLLIGVCLALVVYFAFRWI